MQLDAATHRRLAHGSLTQSQLERVVAQLQVCLGQLAPTQRSVLVLRGGLGPRPALSRAQVASWLGLGVPQTRQIEQRGLRRLDALDAAGRCVAGGGAVPFGTLLASAPFDLSGSSSPVGDGAALGRSHGGVKGVSESGTGNDGNSVLGVSLPPPLGQGSDWTLLILLMVAGLIALLVRRELRRQRGH